MEGIPFEPGKTYDRQKDIHAKFKGQEQGGNVKHDGAERMADGDSHDVRPLRDASYPVVRSKYGQALRVTSTVCETRSMSRSFAPNRRNAVMCKSARITMVAALPVRSDTIEPYV